MKIKDIKDPALRDLALSRCFKKKGLGDKLVSAFEWEYTPEGHQFWWDVELGIITKYDEEKESTKKIEESN